MKELSLTNQSSVVEGAAVYDLPVRDDLFCANCKVPSVHHRLYPASIDCFKSGIDWHLTCKGTTIALIPHHVIKKIFDSLSEAYKMEQLNTRFPLLETHEAFKE